MLRLGYETAEISPGGRKGNGLLQPEVSSSKATEKTETLWKDQHMMPIHSTKLEGGGAFALFSA